MSIDALTALSSASVSTIDPTTRAPGAAQALDFGKVLDRELTALNTQLHGAEQSLAQLASGESANLHRVMLDLEQTRLSFQLAVQVRNKLLEGYQDVMRMQI
jgi:flagellar hook-basal body complex protein FliE